MNIVVDGGLVTFEIFAVAMLFGPNLINGCLILIQSRTKSIDPC